MPVLLSRREPNHVTRVNLLDRTTLPLSPSAARRHDQGLSEGMGMPGRPGSRFECDARTSNKGRVGRLKERVDTDGTGKPLCRTFARGLRTETFDLHHHILVGSRGVQEQAFIV